MNREQLIQALAGRIDVPPHSAQVFLHACFDIIKSQLRSGDEITLPLLGRWAPLREEDGILTGVSYSALVENRPDPTGDMLHGPASSIDARHFIPAAALEHGNGVRRTPVDIAALVAEVRREYAPESIPDPAAAPISDAVPSAARSDSLPPVEDSLPPAPVVDSEEDILLEAEMEAENYAVHASAPEHEITDGRRGEEYSAGDEECDDGYDSPGDDEGADDGHDPLGDDGEVDDGHDPLGDDGEVDDGHDPLGDDEEVDDGHDPLGDDEVFNRNRDQLYHPPAETSKRPLLIAAAILTLCVLVIIVYILLDHTAPRELPGSEPVGMRAVAGEFQAHS